LLHLSADTLKEFSKAIMAVGELEEYRDREGNPVRRYESSDLEVLFSRLDGSWKFTGLSFWLFGANFIVDETGAVYAIDEDEDIESVDSVFMISDRDMKLAIRSYIQWRVNVARKLQF